MYSLDGVDVDSFLVVETRAEVYSRVKSELDLCIEYMHFYGDDFFKVVDDIQAVQI